MHPAFSRRVEFINSYEIRKGEFEGNEYVIMKIDRDNIYGYFGLL